MVFVVITLLAIGVVLILFGMFTFQRGMNLLSKEPTLESLPGEPAPTVTSKFLEFMTTGLKVMLDANAKPADRQIAAGTFLILLGIVFLLSSLVSGVVNAFIPVRA